MKKKMGKVEGLISETEVEEDRKLKKQLARTAFELYSKCSEQLL